MIKLANVWEDIGFIKKAFTKSGIELCECLNKEVYNKLINNEPLDILTKGEEGYCLDDNIKQNIYDYYMSQI